MTRPTEPYEQGTESRPWRPRYTRRKRFIRWVNYYLLGRWTRW